MSKPSSVNWPARILLWILWPIGWMILLPIAQGLLSAIRASFVQTAKQGADVGTVAHTYGVINAIVMGGLTLLLPAGFVFVARATRKKTLPASPSSSPAAPPPVPGKPTPPAAPAAEPKKRTHGCLVAFLICIGMFVVLAALGIFGGGQAVMKSAEKTMRESPLCVAAAAGNWQEVDRLLARGVDPNQSAMMGHSALIMATDNGHVQIAERLLKAGADPNQKDNLGWAPLHHAVKTDAANLDMITMLAGYRANVNITDKHLRTPLHRAAQFGHIDAVRLLLRWGADPNAKDENGWTPRDQGAAHPSIVALLHPQPVARVWTGRNGKQITATFQKESGGYVYLQKQDGGQIQTQRSNLSDSDVTYLNSMR